VILPRVKLALLVWVRDAISYIVTRPRRMAINELLVRPTEQEQ